MVNVLQGGVVISNAFLQHFSNFLIRFFIFFTPSSNENWSSEGTDLLNDFTEIMVFKAATEHILKIRMQLEEFAQIDCPIFISNMVKDNIHNRTEAERITQLYDTKAVSSPNFRAVHKNRRVGRK